MKRLLMASALLLPLAMGCTTTRVVSTGETAAVAPMLTVERFLQASNSRDLHGMASLFGTSDGPIIETGSTLGCAFKKMGSWIGLGQRCLTLQEVELQMDAIAAILRYQDYSVVTENPVPGRVDPTSRVGVNLVIQGRDYMDVPFLVVKTGGGRWLVEEIDLTKVTGD
jgi:hypothetical protein